MDKRDQKERRFQVIVNRSIRQTFSGHCHIRDTDPEMTVVGGRSSRNIGRPDIVGHVFGAHLEVELKVYPNRPTAEQKSEIRKVIETGGLAFVMLWHSRSDKYYMIPHWAVEDFSYRKREKWIELSSFKDAKGLVSLNLRPLAAMIVTHLAGMKEIMSPE